MTDTGGVGAPQPATPGPRDREPPIDLYAVLVGAVRSFRRWRPFRTSSALVRWALMVALIGVGAAFLIALTVQILISLIPNAGG